MESSANSFRTELKKIIHKAKLVTVRIILPLALATNLSTSSQPGPNKESTQKHAIMVSEDELNSAERLKQAAPSRRIYELNGEKSTPDRSIPNWVFTTTLSLDEPSNYCPELPTPDSANSQGEDGGEESQQQAESPQEDKTNEDTPRDVNALNNWLAQSHTIYEYQKDIKKSHTLLIPVGYPDPQEQMAYYANILKIVYGKFPVNFSYLADNLPVGITSNGVDAYFTNNNDFEAIFKLYSNKYEIENFIFLVNSTGDYGVTQDKYVLVATNSTYMPESVVIHEGGHLLGDLTDGYFDASNKGSGTVLNSTEFFTSTITLRPDVRSSPLSRTSPYYPTKLKCGPDLIFHWGTPGVADMMTYPYDYSIEAILKHPGEVFSPLQKSLIDKNLYDSIIPHVIYEQSSRRQKNKYKN